MDRKLFVFDIDGTIADSEYRQDFLRTKPRNWKAFQQSLTYHKPIQDIVWLLKLFHSQGHIIVFATARPEDDREDTTYWLDNVAGLKGMYEALFMRAKNDFRDDSIVKEEFVQKLQEQGYPKPFMVFDDRSSAVYGWRAAGVRCMQVAPGNF